jgi:hypothetical protein
MKNLGNSLKRFFVGLLFTFIPLEALSQKYSFERQRQKQIQLIKDQKYEEVEFSNRWYSWTSKKVIEYNLLLVMEQEIMMLLKQDYEELLTAIMDHELDLFRSRNNRTYLIGFRFQSKPYEYAEKSFGDEFNQTLLSHLNFQSENIIRNIQNSNLTEEERLFLIYFMHLNIYYGDKCSGHFEKNMLEAARIFSEKFPSSKYLRLIRKYSKYYKSGANWGTDFSFILGGFSAPVSGNGGEYFQPTANFLGLGYGLNYKNAFIKYELSFSETKMKQSLFDGYKHLNNNAFKGRSSRFYVGYSFHVNELVTLSPFVGFDTRRTKGEIELIDNNSVKHGLEHHQNSLMFGLNIDLGDNIYRCDGTRANRIYQRFQLGVSSIDVPFGSKLLSSKMFFMQYSFGFHNQRETRLRALPDYMYL